MTTTIKVLTILLMAADLIFCIWEGLHRSTKIENEKDYFIAGGKTNGFFLTMTAFSSLLGAGLFVGQAGRGYTYGISAYWQLFGEGIIAGIVMALVIGPYLAKFQYFSMAHFIGDHICGGDTTIRRIAGVANFLPNMLWAGGQIMGVSYVIQLLFGLDFRLVAAVVGAIFIFYTMCGGVGSVIVTDALHGMIALVCCFSVIFFGFKLFHFDLGQLKAAVVALDPNRWDMMYEMTPLKILTAFLTGFLGTLANPIYWNRAFAAESPSTCRKAYAFAFTVGTILPLFTILLGLVTFTFTQDSGDYALIWLVVNKMPGFMTCLVAMAVLAACLSSADTHLNCAAANIVSDIIDPKHTFTTEQTVKYSRIATLVCGVISVLVSMFADMIYQLANFGYTVCGGVLIPMFALGYIMMDKKSETYKSKLTHHGALCGIIFGMIVACAFQAIPSLSSFWGGGVIPCVVATVIGVFVGNALSPKKAEIS
jgi:solute:Na+ symporter, SSS family